MAGIGGPRSPPVSGAGAEATLYRQLPSWPLLLECIDDQCWNIQATLALQMKDVCREVLAFMLVVQPRKVVFHPHSLKQGWQSVEALISAAEVVQGEAGPPVPGTYRHDFRNDTTPRWLPYAKNKSGPYTALRPLLGHRLLLPGPR